MEKKNIYIITKKNLKQDFASLCNINNLMGSKMVEADESEGRTVS